MGKGGHWSTLEIRNFVRLSPREMIRSYDITHGVPFFIQNPFTYVRTLPHLPTSLNEPWLATPEAVCNVTLITYLPT